MTVKIRCFTLFDITRTGILNRRMPYNLNEVQAKAWEFKRNQQCNFDTVIQIISLRTQPEEITEPKKLTIEFAKFDKFGFLFENEEPQNCWTFDFTVNNTVVFNDGIHDLGALLTDCDGVPMIKYLQEWDKLPEFLDTSVELRNIHFEII